MPCSDRKHYVNYMCTRMQHKMLAEEGKIWQITQTKTKPILWQLKNIIENTVGSTQQIDYTECYDVAIIPAIQLMM